MFPVNVIKLTKFSRLKASKFQKFKEEMRVTYEVARIFSHIVFVLALFGVIMYKIIYIIDKGVRSGKREKDSGAGSGDTGTDK